MGRMARLCKRFIDGVMKILRDRGVNVEQIESIVYGKVKW